MSVDTTSRHGPLALLGGEGLRHDSRGVWQRLAASAGQPARAVIVPAALGGQTLGAAARQTGLAQETLAAWGISAEVVPVTSRSEANHLERGDAVQTADLIVLPGGNARTLTETLAGTEAWRLIREAHARGGVLVAAGSAAVALGAVAFAPPKPGPGTLDELHFEPFEGLALLPELVILPYFNWLQDALATRIAALCPPGAWLAGIDDQAALIGADGAWRVDGLGQVTLWQPGKRPHVVDVGRALPTDLLPPYPPR